MADDDGFVTLGLQIENTATNQLAKIGSDAEKAAKKTFGNTEKTIQQTVDKSYERTQKLYAEWGRVGESFSKLSGKEIEAPKINTQHFEVAENALDLMEQKLGNIGAQIGAVTEKLSQTESEYAKIGAEKGFDSSEALKLENTLTSLQSKLIGLQSTALSTEEKLARATAKILRKGADSA